MRYKSRVKIIFLVCLLGIGLSFWVFASTPETTHPDAHEFPPDIESYQDAELKSIVAIFANRVKKAPFNLVATLIFFCAIGHTFLTSKFLALSHHREMEHKKKIKQGLVHRNSVDLKAGLFHFFGEVEVVFGMWAVALGGAVCFFLDWPTLVGYISQKVNFTEPVFVVTIMTLASTRPILKLAEKFMSLIANLLGGTLTVWWFTILILGPTIGSLITEPAAMTISALLLANKFFALEPSTKFKYATIGLLFVNISVGGTLTHFAAPPVLMVAGPWGWGTVHMLSHFGWKAIIAMIISTGIYFLLFRNELTNLQEKYALKNLKDEIQKTYLAHRSLDAEIDQVINNLDKNAFVHSLKDQLEEKSDEIKVLLREKLREQYGEELRKKGIAASTAEEAFEQRFEEMKLLRLRENYPGLLPEQKKPEFSDPLWDSRDDPVPIWIILVHIGFMLWTILNAHHAPLVIGGLLFFLGFAQISSPYQNRIDLMPPLLVGFFLAGLVIHGGLQAWWIEPILGNLKEIPLMLTATGLTAFNDNAAITYLSTLVPGFTAELKYAILAGGVAGGGLTVIANAPNPAGQSLLKKYFENGVAPAGLLKAALLPTVVVVLVFLLFR